MKQKLEHFYESILFRLYKEEVFRYCEWMNYIVGFTGHGPTAFDKRPTHLLSDIKLPKWYQRKILRDFASIAIIRQQYFDDAMREVLGE